MFALQRNSSSASLSDIDNVMITGDIHAAILRSQGYAVFEYVNDGLFQPLGQPPSWWIEISGEIKSPIGSVWLAERFPFIESFLIEAQEFWLLKSEDCVRSGIWMEEGRDRSQVPLECSALWLDERRLFLIQAIPVDIYEQQYHLFQTARQARLIHGLELSHAHAQIGIEHAGRKRVEEALAQNEAEFRMIFENAAIGIALVDASGHLTRSNRALQTMLGYPEKELCKLTLVGITHPDEVGISSLYSEMVGGKRDQYQMKKRYLRKDGKTGWARFTVSALRQGSGRLQRCVAMVEDITQQELAEQSLRQLTGRLIRAQEEERSRIARELHDDVNQRLGLLAIELGQLHDSLVEGNHELLERLDKICRETDDISEGVHRLSHNLHSSILENLGLVPAVRNLCMEFSDQHGIKVEFEARKVPSGFSSEVALCLFRILQECLRNVAKHSRARRAKVRLDGDSREIRLIVEDDGAGFDLEARQGKPGLGLVSIRERLRLVSGDISIRSSPSRGTRIEARAPLAGRVDVGRPEDGRFKSAAM